MIKGISASQGITIAKVYRLEKNEMNIYKKNIIDVNQELAKLDKAIKDAEKDLTSLRDHTLEKLGKDKADIFEAHLLVLNDPELIPQVIEKIKNEKINADYVLKQVRDMFVSLFENMDNEYMRERATDIIDVTNRVLTNLLNIKTKDLSLIEEEVIIVAHDLTPSLTAQMDKKYIKGIITNVGGKTSHAAIMARSMEIPAVVGTNNILEQVKDNTIVILDAIKGEVIIDPTKEDIKRYQELMEKYATERIELQKLKDKVTLTKDGKRVELAANIGSPNDLQSVLDNGAEGIGLFRTEFLYMDKDKLPTEEEQFNAYKSVLKKMQKKPVVIRTLDIGGDKKLPYL